MPLNPKARALLDEVQSNGSKPAADSTVAEARAAAWKWAKYMGAPEIVGHIEDVFIPGPSAELPVRIYTPAGRGPFRGLVYFHGGGWVAGNIHLADHPARSLANASQCVVVAVNYQKAPEHPFPTAVNDCLAALQWTVDNSQLLNIIPTQLGVGGDSAGGNLAAAVCLAARELRPPLPAFQLLIYPALDAALNSRSAARNSDGYGLTTSDLRWYWQRYLSVPADRDNPLACPLSAPNLDHLPPAIVVTAEYDPLCDDGLRYAERLEAAGSPVIRHHYPGTIHGFLWMATALDEFRGLLTRLPWDLDVLLKAGVERHRR